MTKNNVAAQAGDEPMPDLVAAIKGLKCTPPDYRNYAMDAEQRGYHKDGFRDGFKAAISAATALAAQVSPRATADVEREKLREVHAFLMGESPLEGVQFGEKHPTKAGAYWWRLNLRAALAKG